MKLKEFGPGGAHPKFYYVEALADPGFSREECTNFQIGIILQILCQKLHENERIWTAGWRPCVVPYLKKLTKLPYLEKQDCMQPEEVFEVFWCPN